MVHGLRQRFSGHLKRRRCTAENDVNNGETSHSGTTGLTVVRNLFPRSRVPLWKACWKPNENITRRE